MINKLNLTIIISISILMLSCSVDGRDEYSMWSTFNHADNDFKFLYLAPPWIFDDESTDERPVMVILSDGDEKKVTTKLEARSRLGDTALELATKRFETYKKARCEVKKIYEHVNYSGDNGVGFDATCDSIELTEVFFDIDEGVVFLKVVLYQQNSKEDIQLLIDSFEPGYKAEESK